MSSEWYGDKKPLKGLVGWNEVCDINERGMYVPTYVALRHDVVIKAMMYDDLG